MYCVCRSWTVCWIGRLVTYISCTKELEMLQSTTIPISIVNNAVHIHCALHSLPFVLVHVMMFPFRIIVVMIA